MNDLHSREKSVSGRLKGLVLGRGRDIFDPHVFRHISLIAFFAWVGLGADPLSSSSYGPEEAFLALAGHTHLAIFVALMSALTIVVISASYSQIIELFPSGGGGYLVASKLLSPGAGMVSGCALVIDYVLTITISLASGADYIFSFLPAAWLPFKLYLAMLAVVVMTVMNMRGVKESIIPLVPVFTIFVVTHAFFIVYAVLSHSGNLPEVAARTATDIKNTHASVGAFGMMVLLLRAYSMGAGTFTGIEAVSNGMPILRDPKVQTAKRTMRYMAVSLSFMVLGLMVSYLLFGVEPVHGKTLNAVLYETITKDWGRPGYTLLIVTLVSEAVLLFVAAQAGFIDGPRVLANMAIDRWVPTKYSMLSNRLVAQKGIMLMGGAALAMMVLTGGSVRFLVVLYAINVFITFTMSQLGMVRHWWLERGRADHWRKKLFINGLGLALTTFILVTVTILKFHEGGWITLIITAALVAVAVMIKRHYNHAARLLSRLDGLVEAAGVSLSQPEEHRGEPPRYDPRSKTAIILVNGFNGLGIHTLLNVVRLFGHTFRNFAFVEIGVVDAGNFKGVEELEHLQKKVERDLKQYVDYMHRQGFHAEGFSSIGIDVVEETAKLVPKVIEKYPQSVVFGGQLVFPNPGFLTGALHNYTIFAVQKFFYREGIPIVLMPIRV